MLTRTILSFIVLGVLIGSYIVFYTLNSKIKKPKDCQEMDVSCHGCTITSCSHYKGGKND